MPAYSARGLLAGPYWDATDRDPANPLDPNNEPAQGLLETLPAWATPMMPSWPGDLLQPWPGQTPTDQIPDDLASILSPAPTLAWWLGLSPPAPQPLLPP